MMEFHIAREVRDRYRFSQTLFSFSGNVVFANLAASREFAHRMNQVRNAEQDPARVVHPGALYAMGLIDEMSHALVAAYRKQAGSSVLQGALGWFEERLGPLAVQQTLAAFVERFPSGDVYRGKVRSLEWLQGATDGVHHRTIAFEEMMLLWLANANPAFTPFSELFADQELARGTSYREIVSSLRDCFAAWPPIGPEKLNLVDMLRAPSLASPASLAGQLAFIREKWAAVLGSSLDWLLLAIDVLKEEDVAIWMRFHPPLHPHRPGGHGASSEVPSYSAAALEYERFSPDQEWMPTTVLLAKSTYVWLEQLSRQYGRNIYRLDQIPSEELALMASRGLNALWLIGVWERSRASQTIKQLCGNPDAVASAYSLNGYSIAADLGGEAAYRDLRERAYVHGIRLASDMVPNHMGIDSDWVIHHPDWFISRSDSPYPAYRFEGPNLSNDGRVEIKIEDHYYEQTDAAVVFRRRDMWTGDTRYVYHGNDGTSFPWNDTAQLDYLNREAREQVIQTILHVARLFPIIRFDAAMTLAKRHFERLWYPLPGTGGAIPSRAEFSLSKAQFDAAMPEEFWREVVDRVAREVPGTLLLAEAFWLMEGYFVRTLGMHRVYNSAFMNMLRDEENAKYRSVIKNTIEFDPDILKRYVNFMSNPDERTAIDQFGRDDKCFGVATLMATLPGLPMFGHGQIEGFTEKYGMEFRKARYQEQPDPWLVERHEREIAPLLHRRWLFAESRNFLLYDFYRPEGSVDENVFAYSNQRGDQRALIVYHNRYATARGTIHHSAAYADKSTGQQRRQSVGAAFGLSAEGNMVVAYRDLVTGLEYLRRSSSIVSEGFSIELHAYQRHVFLDWRELVPDEQHHWDRLCDFLNGRGVRSVDDALISLELMPVHDALAALLNPDLLHSIARLSSDDIAAGGEADAAVLHQLKTRSTQFFAEASRAYARRVLGEPCLTTDPRHMWPAMRDLVRSATRLPSLETRFSAPWSAEARAVLPSASPHLAAPAIWGPVLAWCALRAFGESIDCRPLGGEAPGNGSLLKGSPGSGALDAFERLRLREPLARALGNVGLEGEDRWRAAARVRQVLLAEAMGSKAARVAGFPPTLWDDPETRWLIQLHAAPDSGSVLRMYFNQELHEQLVWWIHLPKLVEIAQLSEAAPLLKLESQIQGALEQTKRAEYRLDGLLTPSDGDGDGPVE